MLHTYWTVSDSFIAQNICLEYFIRLLKYLFKSHTEVIGKFNTFLSKISFISSK